MSDAMARITRRWTVARLEGLPDDGNRYEIINGELHVTTASHVWRQVVVEKVGTALEAWSSQTGRGLMIPGPGVIFSPHRCGDTGCGLGESVPPPNLVVPELPTSKSMMVYGW